MRVTKKPEIRRKELMNAAEDLFIEKGYEQVEVSEIAKKVGVVKGTFYYYFKSKEAILDAIIDKYISILVEDMENMVNQKDLTALEKLMNIYPFALSFPSGHKSIMHHLQEEKNVHLSMKLEQRIPQETAGLLTRIIKQGIEEGVFNIKYPEEAAGVYMGTMIILQGIENLDPNSLEFKRKFMAIFYFIERILGAEEGLIIKFMEKNSS
ncbi:TetR/AcrR family transcriptional regulator [Methanobacterium congolense]|uniref:Transposon Tn10 TetC protein n=1 Tax=Methanobacterium congolense TaxID=118062 RepID=A0A1D3L204_9EURY|nr:TetR/AcrR family transcriptional regulator [Methanobacterium congolense]SCG85661.1 Transposon Tn10 TetC protein [Methanobacterium congolense]